MLIYWTDRKQINAISIKAVCSIDTEMRFIYRYYLGEDDIANAKEIHIQSIDNGDVNKSHLYLKSPHLFYHLTRKNKKESMGILSKNY